MSSLLIGIGGLAFAAFFASVRTNTVQLHDHVSNIKWNSKGQPYTTIWADPSVQPLASQDDIQIKSVNVVLISHEGSGEDVNSQGKAQDYVRPVAEDFINDNESNGCYTIVNQDGTGPKLFYELKGVDQNGVEYSAPGGCGGEDPARRSVQPQYELKKPVCLEGGVPTTTDCQTIETEFNNGQIAAASITPGGFETYGVKNGNCKLHVVNYSGGTVTTNPTAISGIIGGMISNCLENIERAAALAQVDPCVQYSLTTEDAPPGRLGAPDGC